MSIEKTKEFVRDIIEGRLSVEERNAIVVALRERRKVQALENAASFRLGLIVRPFNMTPKELNECEGEIIGFSPQRKKVDLRLTKTPPFGRFVTGKTYKGFPVSNLNPVTATVPEIDIDNSDNSDGMTALQNFLRS